MWAFTLNVGRFSRLFDTPSHRKVTAKTVVLVVSGYHIRFTRGRSQVRTLAGTILSNSLSELQEYSASILESLLQIRVEHHPAYPSFEVIRGGPLDILGGGQKNVLCKNFFF